MDTRARTLAVPLAAATVAVAVVVVVLRSTERHLVRGESMVPAFRPRDTVISVRTSSLLGRVIRPRRRAVAVIALPWEHDLIGIKRLVAAPGEAWQDGDDKVAAGPGWVAVGDQRVLSTDSRHHGRVPDDAIVGVVVARIPPHDVPRDDAPTTASASSSA